MLNKGLVLVTGPTGSGKSTTLCAMIDHINRNRQDHIITIEDPIEFVHPNQKCLINQREVHTHTDSFKAALRAALREDPDIVLVGELRDLETVAIAIETAETGHLVFGTLHTTTAASTVDRIVDQFPADRQEQIRIMLSESLRGVIAQNLCRKIGGGRIAALEVLIATSAVSNLIREGKTFQIPSMMQVGKAVGMVSLNDALMELVTKKLVAPDEAYSKAVDKPGFETLLKRGGFALTVPTKRRRERPLPRRSGAGLQACPSPAPDYARDCDTAATGTARNIDTKITHATNIVNEAARTGASGATDAATKPPSSGGSEFASAWMLDPIPRISPWT